MVIIIVIYNYDYLALLPVDGDDVVARIVVTVQLFVDVPVGKDAGKARLDILRLSNVVGTPSHIRRENNNVL